MSGEQLKASREAVKADRGHEEQLIAAADADAEATLAKAAGFVASAEELNNSRTELSDEELEFVTGGGRGDYKHHANDMPIPF
jgi:predicted ribosomally synthesized peptide with nif11-like leader